MLFCPPRVYFPNLCKFWQHYVGVNGDLIQEDLCHTHTQSLCPCDSPLLTRTSTGDAQIQFCLNLYGVPACWCAQGLFEPSVHLWWEWGLILNMNLPILPSCWGLSFALGRGVSPQSCSSTAQLLFQCLPSPWGISDLLLRWENIITRYLLWSWLIILELRKQNQLKMGST